MGVYLDLLLAAGSAGVMTACIALVFTGGRLPGGKRKIPVELALLGAIGSMTLFLEKGQPGLLTALLEQLGIM